MERTFFLGGWAFVEFYFMLTGYYTTEHFLKHSEKVGAEYRDIFYYIKNKIKKIYPYAVGGGYYLILYECLFVLLERMKKY